MTVREAQDSPLFANRRLQRILWGPGVPRAPACPPPPFSSLPPAVGERLLNPRPGKLPLESIQVVLEELRKNGGCHVSIRPSHLRPVPDP